MGLVALIGLTGLQRLDEYGTLVGTLRFVGGDYRASALREDRRREGQYRKSIVQADHDCPNVTYGSTSCFCPRIKAGSRSTALVGGLHRTSSALTIVRDLVDGPPRCNLDGEWRCVRRGKGYEVKESKAECRSGEQT